MRAKNILFAFVLVTGIGAAQAQISSTKIDVGPCFSSQLVTTVTTNIVTNYLYNYLAVIDEQTYYQVKANSSATALMPAGLFSGDWNAFQESRRKYFELHQESLAYYQSLETKTQFLPVEWRPTIDNCINKLTAASGYGVLYDPITDDPYTSVVSVKYRSTEDGAGPRVRFSQVDNATVVNAKGESVSLYRACYSSWFDRTCPLIDDQSEFILKRADPNKKIHVTLNLTNKQSVAFDIDAFPKAQQCALTYAHSANQTDSRDVEIHTPPNSVLLDEHWGGDNLQLYYIRLQYPGRIQFASCTPLDSYNHVLNNDANQADRWHNPPRSWRHNPEWGDDGVFQCLGATNTGNTRFTHVQVTYQTPQNECADIDWPMPNAVAKK
jgi:hypothetical protein